MRKIALYLLVLAFSWTLTSCAPPQTKTGKGAVYGSAIGAAAGAIVGQAIGHDTKATLEGAAIGAAIGGLSGAAIGRYMDQQEAALRAAMAGSNAATVSRIQNVLEVTYRGDVLFDFNSSVVKPGAYPEIDRLARILREYPDTKIRIEGHTDNIGSEEYNLRLSQRRAEAVRDLLVAKGVSPSRITAIGYGESRPKASNDTSYGRQLNRRVEIFIEPMR